MFDNVLVGVDSRPNCRDAVALARRLAGARSSLTFVNVRSGMLRPTHAVVPEMVKEEREASEKLLEGVRAEAGVEAKLVSVEALSPARGLHEQAEARGADLLVVGSCARGLLGRTLAGDDARAALNSAPCAVAIAAVGVAQIGVPDRAAPFAKIGVAYNGSPESEAALATARELAHSSGASLHAMEVVPITTFAYVAPVATSVDEGIDAELEQADARVKQLAGVEGRAVFGLTGEELAAFGAEVDLLVAGSRGYGPLRRLVLGSTCEYLERHARCSLLVLPRAPLGSPGGNGIRDGAATAELST